MRNGGRLLVAFLLHPLAQRHLVHADIARHFYDRPTALDHEGHRPGRGSAKSLTKRLSCADAPVETWQSRAECRRIAGSEPPGRADLAGEESRDLAGSEPLSRLWARTRAADCHRRTSSPHS